MTCSQSSCVPNARTPSTWVTVLASQPSVSIETETTQRIDPPKLAVLADGVHDFAKQRHVVEFLAALQLVGQLAAALDDLAAEALDLVGCHVAEIVVQRLAGFELLAVDQQRVRARRTGCRARRNCGRAPAGRLPASSSRPRSPGESRRCSRRPASMWMCCCRRR